MRYSPALLCALLAAPALAGECAKTSYGAGVTLAESTPISSLLERPDAWAGKTVRVEGTVAEVCEKAGCWLELRAEEAGQSLRVKVKDGEIVFPTAARGRRASAEGTFETKQLDRAAYLRWAKHLAEEQGRPFDEASIVGDGPFPFHQIAGRGAEICQ